MQREIFSPLAIDALGEMMNISLGSSATAVSNMLDRRVDITTPKVSVVDIESFSIAEIEPAMGVEIKYVSGLVGSNIMLLKREDIKVIVDILMGQESDGSEFVLDELTISAVCEVMNQMMGASATALSDFLGYSVNISTPRPFEMHDFNAFKYEHLPVNTTNMIVVIRFALKIEDQLESEFMNVISVELARELLGGLGLEDEDILGPEAHLLGEVPAEKLINTEDTGNRPLSQEEIEKLMDGTAEEEPASNKQLSQEEIEKLMGGAAEEEPASNKQLSQEEIEKLMSGAAEEEPASNKQLSQEEIEKLLAGGADSAPQSAAQPAPQSAPQPVAQSVPQAAQQPMQQPMPQMMPQMMPPMYQMPDGQMGYPPNYYPPYPYPYPYPYPPQPEEKPQAKAEPKTINARSVKMDEMNADDRLNEEQAQNLELIMEVPLQVTVEIGRTRRRVQDILSYTKGSLVVLDKLAGDQVDVFVNGKCIAKGDVVVVDDNFGVRITEIVQMDGSEGLFSK